MVSTLFTLLPVFLSTICLASTHHGSRTNTHRSLAKRIDIGLDLNLFNVENRITGARFTFYDVGLGACGQTNVESDFIVAVNAIQFGVGFPGPNCFKTITIKYNGKSANAKIMDMCPGCPYGGLDLSRGLFRYFASEDQGVIYGEWHYGSDSDSSPGSPANAGHGRTLSTVSSKPHKPTSSYTHRPESVLVKPSSNTPIATRVALPTYWPMPDGLNKAQAAKSIRLPSTSTFHWQTSLPFSQALHTTLSHNSVASNRNVTTSTFSSTAIIVPQTTTSATTNATSTPSYKDHATSVMSTEINTVDSNPSGNLVVLSIILGRLGQIAAMAVSS